MKIVYFTHSLQSCWNHGNAHFLRGVLSDLQRRGHDVAAYERQEAWSLENLRRDAGEAGLDAYRDAYPHLHSIAYGADFDPGPALEDADIVIVHEWNAPALVAAIGRVRRRGLPFTLLFHDTHHRAVSDPEAIRTFDLSGYDGILAFGETLAAVYRRWGWEDRVFVWHEAADVALFRPPATPQDRRGLVWIGNWGDGERSAELEEFLFAPVRETGLPLDIYGVRYPPEALEALRHAGAHYHGWAPNALAPAIFARHRVTVHVPRRFYVDALPGIPTIRVFEALACGIPLVSAPWNDSEHLFEPGRDFLVAKDRAEMVFHLRALDHEPALRQALADHGRKTILARHTCGHRVDELFGILGRLETLPARALP